MHGPGRPHRQGQERLERTERVRRPDGDGLGRNYRLLHRDRRADIAGFDEDFRRGNRTGERVVDRGVAAGLLQHLDRGEPELVRSARQQVDDRRYRRRLLADARALRITLALVVLLIRG
jgi:hypothetical protein